MILDIPPRSLEQPLWSSVASQSVSHTQPIGSKPIVAATSSNVPKGTWNTDIPLVQSYKGESLSTLRNYRERKESHFMGEGQVDEIQTLGSNNYQTSDNISFHSPIEKVRLLSKIKDFPVTWDTKLFHDKYTP